MSLARGGVEAREEDESMDVLARTAATAKLR